MRHHGHGISVVIPTSGRRPELLAGALAAIAAQERRPDEILVVDDSGEGRVVLPPGAGVRVLRAAHGGAGGGVSAARNLGARAARGRWIAFLDDDDLWLSGYLATLEEEALHHGANVLCASFLATRGDRLVPEKSAPEELRHSDFFRHNPGLRGSNLFIDRRLFLAAGGFDPALPAFNDLDLGLRLAAREEVRYRGLGERLVVFRNHPGPRLTSRASPAVRAALPRFLARYGARMSRPQWAALRERFQRFWGMDRPPA